MAKFIYRMENILNLRERLETQAKTEYGEMTLKLAQEEDKMRLLVSRMRAYEDEMRGSSGKRLNILDMKRCNESISTLKELAKQQAIEIKVAQRNLEKAREHLNEAMQERKIQEKLKEKAFDQFKMELNTSEMKEIDEVVTFNYNDREIGE